MLRVAAQTRKPAPTAHGVRDQQQHMHSQPPPRAKLAWCGRLCRLRHGVVQSTGSG
jgi:hypothetical protein